MIMPNKYLTQEETLLGVGKIILDNLSSKKTLSELWEKIKDNESVYNYERFILGLDMLFILGIIDIDDKNILEVIK